MFKVKKYSARFIFSEIFKKTEQNYYSLRNSTEIYFIISEDNFVWI